MVGLQTSHRCGNASMLAADFVFGIGNRWANRHTGSVETYTKGKKIVHIDIEPTQIGRVFEPTFGIASDAKSALELLLAGVQARKAAGTWPSFADWAGRCAERKRLMGRKSHFTETPMKPMRVYEEMNAAFGRDTTYVSTIGLSQIAAAQFLNVYGARQWINCGQAGPLGWTIPAALGVAVAKPNATVVGISGDYDFQFLIEELAVGAQFRIPYVHVLVNNSYLGLIRQSQRGFDMDFCVQLAFENQNIPEDAEGNLRGYGVDHVTVVQGLGCKALRVTDPEKVQAALRQAQQMAAEFRVPVVVECILEKVTNVAMGVEIDKINEFEPIDCRHAQGREGLVAAGLLD
jgi:tartronate-semialdehyde synthase